MTRWGEDLWLLTEDELDQLADGTMLLCINGLFVSKSKELDRDTRFGYLAYGLTEELVKEQGLENKFLLMMLS